MYPSSQTPQPTPTTTGPPEPATKEASPASRCAGAAAGVYCSPRCFGSRGADCEIPLPAAQGIDPDPLPWPAQFLLDMLNELDAADQVERGICRHDARPIARRVDRPGASWVHDDEGGGRDCADQATEAEPVTTLVAGKTVIVRRIETDGPAGPTRATYRGHGEPERAQYFGCGPTAERSGQPATFRRSGRVLLIIDAAGAVIDRIGANGKIWLASTPPRPAAPVDVDHQIDQALAAERTRTTLSAGLDELKARLDPEATRTTPPPTWSAEPAPADQVGAALADAPRMPLAILSFNGQVNFNLGSWHIFAPEILSGIAAQPAGDTEPVLAIVAAPNHGPTRCFVFTFPDRAAAQAWWNRPSNELPDSGGRLLIVADPDGPEVLRQHLAIARDALAARRSGSARDVTRLATTDLGSEDHIIWTQVVQQGKSKLQAAQDLVDRLTTRAEAAGLVVDQPDAPATGEATAPRPEQPPQRAEAAAVPVDVDGTPIRPADLVECVGEPAGVLTGRRGRVQQVDRDPDGGPGRVLLTWPDRPGAGNHARSANRVRVLATEPLQAIAPAHIDGGPTALQAILF